MSRNTAPHNKPIPYTEYEISLLKELWTTTTNKELLKHFPNRTYIGLRYKAHQLGLPVERTRMRKGSLKYLEGDNLDVWYWLGFILADGHITKSGQLVVVTMEKDREHLQKLATKLICEIKNPYANTEYNSEKYANQLIQTTEEQVRSIIRIAVQEPKIAKSIKDRLGLTDSNKTYNPPCIDIIKQLTIEQNIALFIGFFDGDGSSIIEQNTQKPRRGSIQSHESWFELYNYWNELNFISKVHTVKNTVVTKIYSRKMLDLAGFIAQYQLPHMERKWLPWDNERIRRNGSSDSGI